MANVKISELPSATLPLSPAELIPLVQNNVTVKSPLASIAWPALYAESFGIKASNTAASNDIGWAALKTALGSGGKTVILPAGRILFNASIDCSNLTNVVFRGAGGEDLTYSGNFGTVLQFQGTGSGHFVNMQNHRAVWWRDTQFLWSSSLFTGTVINQACNFSSGCGSGFVNCMVYRASGGGYSPGQAFYLKDNVDVTYRNVYIAHTIYGWVGAFNADVAPGTNVVRFEGCTTIENVVAAVVNPTTGWNFWNCNFELGKDGAPAGILATGAHSIIGLSLFGCIFADSDAGGWWIDLPVDTYNFTMKGGAVLGATGSMSNGIRLGSVFNGCPTIESVNFGSIAKGIEFLCSTVGAVVQGNNFLNVSGTKITGAAFCDVGSVFRANNPDTENIMSLNRVTLTAPATGATITIANGKTFTASNTLTLSGTDASTLNVGTGGTLGTAAFAATGTSGATVPLLNGANVWSGSNAFTNGIRVGNSAAGSTLGTVTKKIEIFDAAGISLGFLPVYDAIT